MNFHGTHTNFLTGRPPQVSFLYNAVSWAGANSAGADMEFRVRGGAAAVPQAVARALGSKLRLNTAVRKAQFLRGGAGKEGEQLDGETDIQILADDLASGRSLRFLTKFLILTGPPSVLADIEIVTSVAVPRTRYQFTTWRFQDTVRKLQCGCKKLTRK